MTSSSDNVGDRERLEILKLGALWCSGVSRNRDVLKPQPWRVGTQDEELREELTLDGIVTVVDAAHIEQHLDEDKPEGVENEVLAPAPAPATIF